MFMQFSDSLKTLGENISPNDLENKRVLLRADFNVPMDKNRNIDDKEVWRIRATIPTIEYLIKQNAKVIIMSHLGRPKGNVIESLRLGPVQDKLSEMLDISISRTPDCIGPEVEKAISEMDPGEVLMLENLRFHAEEEKNDKKFAEKLSKLGDIYINDAFADSHRAHASIVGITEFLPSYAGFLMEKEIKMMNRAAAPIHPAVAIIGGIKIETKLPTVKTLSRAYDCVLVGGIIANEIINTSLSKTISPNVILPISDGLAKQKYFDIGSNSVKEFAKFIQEAKSIIWNGPVGKFEEPEFSEGTRGVVDAIRIAYKNGARILIGGGETIAAIEKFAPEFMKYNEKPDRSAGRIYISTGGGAMLEFLGGKKLPGIEALKSQF